MTNAKLDQNSRPTLTALSSANDGEIVTLFADPITHRLLVDTPSATGTVKTVSITTALGVSGNSDGDPVNPSLVIVLGDIQPTSIASAGNIHGGTLQFDVGHSGRLTYTDISGVLTEAPAFTDGTDIQVFGNLTAANLSGTNTGDQNLSGYAPLADPVFTGNPTAPTATSTDNDTTIATTAFVQSNKIGYTLQASMGGFNPADATTYYIGGAGFAGGTTSGLQSIYIPKTGTVKSIYGFLSNGGTLGTNETSTISFRYNDTTDTTISSSVVTNTTKNAFNATGLSIAVTAGSFFEIKWVTPTWATNPTTIRGIFVVYIE